MEYVYYTTSFWQYYFLDFKSFMEKCPYLRGLCIESFPPVTQNEVANVTYLQHLN